MKKTLLFLSSLFFISKIAFSQVDINLIDSFQLCINQHITNTSDIGISAAVIMPNGAIWAGAAGDDGMSLPIQTNTPFYAASTSKTFIAACYMQLSEAGTINLNTPIYQYLTSNKYPSAYIDSTITLQQLLNHTSGIYNYGDNPNYMNYILGNSSQVYHHGEALTLFLNQPQLFNEGTSYSYSNSNYVLLAMILEKITNSELKDEMYNRIIQPLNLTATFPFDSTTANSSAGFWANTGGSSDLNFSNTPHTALMTSSWGPGHMVSIPSNLATYCRALIKGQLYTNSSTISTMLSIVPMSTTTAGYGYGIGIERVKYAGNYLYGHTGNIGHITYMFHSPTGDYTIVTMTNRYSTTTGSANALAFKALERIILRNLSYPLGVSEKTEPADFNSYPNPTSDAITIDIPGNDISTISISDLFGKEVVKQLTTGVQTTIRTSELQNGVYFLKVNNMNGVSVKIIMVSK